MAPPVVAYYTFMGVSALIGGYMIHNATTNITNKMNQDKAPPPPDAPQSDGNTSSPSNDSAAAAQGAKKQLAGNTGDCGTGNCDDPNEKKSNNKKFSPQETDGLRQLFGKGPQGAQDLLDKLNAGQTVNLPAGVTADTLQSYSQIAQQQINLGLDSSGVQQLRLQAIGKLLGK